MIMKAIGFRIRSLVEVVVKTLILLTTALLFTACDRGDPIRSKNGHLYIWHPYQEGHYIHDPNCSQCKKMENHHEI